MKFDPYKIIKYPLNTEKAVRLMDIDNKMLFIVDRKSKKSEIKKAVEEAFGVKVIKVNTLIDHKGNKRAYVRLSPDTPAMDINTKLGLM